MNKELNEKQIREIIKKERDNSIHSYKDEGDLVLDLIVSMYEKKEINEGAFKVLVSKTLLNLTENTVNDLRSDLIKNNLNLTNNNDTNKIFFLNYSKKSYA